MMTGASSVFVLIWTVILGVERKIVVSGDRSLLTLHGPEKTINIFVSKGNGTVPRV